MFNTKQKWRKYFIYWEVGNRLINKSVFELKKKKNMSHESFGIFNKTYLFNLFTKKDFESEGERRKKE